MSLTQLFFYYQIINSLNWLKIFLRLRPINVFFPMPIIYLMSLASIKFIECYLFIRLVEEFKFESYGLFLLVI